MATTACLMAGSSTIPALSIGLTGAIAAKCVEGSLTGTISSTLKFSVRLIPRCAQIGNRVMAVFQQRAMDLIAPYTEFSLGMFC